MSTISASPTESIVNPDQALLAALRAGSEQAYEQMVREHSPRASATALRMLRCEADALDAVQDAFFSAFKSLDSFQGDAALGTWLHRIVVNASLMKLRKRRQHDECSLDELLPSFDEAGHRRDVNHGWVMPSLSALERRETREQIMRSIDRLPADYRTVILLRDVEALNTAETANALGIKECTVKVRLHRGRMMLRTLLEREFAG